MRSETLKISPNILQWINETFNESLGSFQKKIDKWLNGISNPTIKQARNLCNKIHIPFRYILMENPPKENCDIIEFRTVNSIEIEKPSRELYDINNKMSQIQLWMEDYIRINEAEHLEFVGKYSDADFKTIVNAIRKILKLEIDYFEKYNMPRECFNFVRKQSQNAGILVMCSGIVGENTHRKLNIKEFRAFAKINKYAPLIFINSNDSWTGRLFSLFHEIAHIFIGLNDLYNSNESSLFDIHSKETLCNKIATELIMPLEIYKNINKSIEECADYFKCSKYVVVRRMLDLNKINKEEYNSYIKQFNKEYEKYKIDNKNSGGNYYNKKIFSLDNRFILALNNSVTFGNTSYVEAYRLTDTNANTYSKVIKELRLK